MNIEEARSSLSGCLLCGRRPIEIVGVVVANTDRAMHEVILRLRTTPLRDGKEPGLCYGLCAMHAQDLDASVIQVESYLLRMAASVVMQ